MTATFMDWSKAETAVADKQHIHYMQTEQNLKGHLVLFLKLHHVSLRNNVF